MIQFDRLSKNPPWNNFQVFFEQPVQVEPDTYYVASAVLDGAELSYFGQEGMSEVTIDNEVTFQFQCSSESTNGTSVQGISNIFITTFC